ncbi:Hypothetical predicted protein [Pelobates cultripes]|uniref:Uncharacterized protein n=1 Tax=Pelobates cultripes TaxID=61616 RepID=A0AAD1RPG2_PELCU|nr:Hypothetical predicted protein [Pelobates cultripes]
MCLPPAQEIPTPTKRPETTEGPSENNHTQSKSPSFKVKRLTPAPRATEPERPQTLDYTTEAIATSNRYPATKQTLSRLTIPQRPRYRHTYTSHSNNTADPARTTQIAFPPQLPQRVNRDPTSHCPPRPNCRAHYTSF